MPTLYEMVIENELTDAVFAISLVDSPAIQEDFVLLSKDDKINIEIKLEKIVDEKKRLVSGPILVTDLVIPRKGYDIVFRKDTIRKLAENFLIQGNQNNITIQHKLPINKVFMVESWIVEDSEKDKSAFLGYNLPVGSWFATYKIADDDLWKEYLESGILKGYSLEGSFGQKEVKMEEIHMHDEYCHCHLSEEDKAILELMDVMLYSQADVDARYVWRLSESDENCPSCVKLNGKVKTLREWAKVALPRMQNNTNIGNTGLVYESPYSAKSGFNCYGTFCEQNCKCQLVKVSDAVKKAIKNPFAKK